MSGADARPSRRHRAGPRAAPVDDRLLDPARTNLVEQVFERAPTRRAVPGWRGEPDDPPVDPWDEHEMDVLQAHVRRGAARRGARRAGLLPRRQRGPAAPRAGRGVLPRVRRLRGPRPREMVGQTWVVGSTIDNLHLAHLWAWVPPRFGRRGHGTALVEYAEQHVRDLGRRTAVTQTWIGADGRGGYRPFAERLGYSLAQTQVERRQRLPMDETTLATARGGGRQPQPGLHAAHRARPDPRRAGPRLPRPLQPDERRDAHRRHRARGRAAHPRGAGPAGGRAPRPGPHPADRPGVLPRRRGGGLLQRGHRRLRQRRPRRSTSGRRSCVPTTAATGWAWPSSAR